MAVRTKGRAKFEFGGRAFVWHVKDEAWVHVTSTDKRFSAAYRWHGEPVVKVSGIEFLGLDADVPRPALLHPPAFEYTNPGELVAKLLSWAFDGSRTLRLVESRDIGKKV